MRCERCHGLMVVDHFLDMQDDRGHLWLRAWRCVNCGDVAEPGVISRRLAHRSLLASCAARLMLRRPRPVETVPLGV